MNPGVKEGVEVGVGPLFSEVGHLVVGGEEVDLSDDRRPRRSQTTPTSGTPGVLSCVPVRPDNSREVGQGLLCLHGTPLPVSVSVRVYTDSWVQRSVPTKNRVTSEGYWGTNWLIEIIKGEGGTFYFLVFRFNTLNRLY